MECRMCGFNFDEKKLINKGCGGCSKHSKHGCGLIHCPNCGFGNSPEFEEEFTFVKNLKDKIKSRS